jgi:hypothetical protein
MTKKYEIYSGRRAVSVEHSISPLQAALDYARSFGFADDEIQRVGTDSVAGVELDSQQCWFLS